MSDVVDIVTHNKTLQDLQLSEFINGESAIDAVRLLVRAIRGNTTLQRIRLFIAGTLHWRQSFSDCMMSQQSDISTSWEKFTLADPSHTLAMSSR